MNPCLPSHHLTLPLKKGWVVAKEREGVQLRGTTNSDRVSRKETVTLEYFSAPGGQRGVLLR